MHCLIIITINIIKVDCNLPMVLNNRLFILSFMLNKLIMQLQYPVMIICSKNFKIAGDYPFLTSVFIKMRVKGISINSL